VAHVVEHVEARVGAHASVRVRAKQLATCAEAGSKLSARLLGRSHEQASSAPSARARHRTHVTRRSGCHYERIHTCRRLTWNADSPRSDEVLSTAAPTQRS
jgi:hypothetical protein